MTGGGGMSRFHDYMARRNMTPASALAEAAIALGLPVFPCDANKRPLTTRGFHDASTDPEQIRRWFTNPAAVMIGVPTGAVSGFLVVDVDVKDGRQGMAWLDANSHRLPQTRTIRTIGQGLHIYLRMPAGFDVRNSASKIAPGIDVRGNGGYVIVPPSQGYSVADDAPIADTPDWLIPALCPPTPAPVTPPVRTAAPRLVDGGSALGREALGQRCDAIRNAPDGAKHYAINESAFAIGGLVSAGHLDEGVAWAELRNALAAILPRCKDTRAAEKTLRRAFVEGMGRPQSVAEPEDQPLAPAVWTLTQIALKREAARKQTAAPALDVAPDLMDVPGAIGMFLEHCQRTAISPQPFLALAAGICLVGALAGRKYRTTTDLRTNFYAVGIADSGGGKDHARKQVRNCLFAANLTQYLGGSDIASGTAIRTAMERHPAALFMVDEFGDWMRSILGEKAQTHKAQIAAYLKELYSTAGTVWVGTEYADQSSKGNPRKDIHSPHACVYGTSTPGQFWAAVAGGSLHDGLMARMLLFVSPVNYPDEQEPDLAEPAPALVEALQAIAAGPASHAAGNIGSLMVYTSAPAAYTVPETPEAAEARRNLRRDQLAQQRRAEGTYVTAIAGRLAENAMKLALVRAVSRDPSNPVIEAGDVAWGRAVAQHCVDTLLREASRHVADSDYEAKLNRALDYIRRHGPISAREMFRKGWRLPERERDEILRSLVEGGLILQIDAGGGPTGGRKSVRYAINQGAAEGGTETSEEAT